MLPNGIDYCVDNSFLIQLAKLQLGGRVKIKFVHQFAQVVQLLQVSHLCFSLPQVNRVFGFSR